MKAALAVLLSVLLASSAMAVTEQLKETAIDSGLAWLAGTQTQSGPEGYWSYANNGTVAATASAALAFIEEGHLPGNDVVIFGTNYGDVVGRAVTYVFNRATVDTRFGVEYAGYERYAEDYDNDGDYTNDGGNGQAIYFEPGATSRRVYTTGICVPVVFALGQALGQDTVIGVGSAAINGLTYAQAMQDLIDWFCWAQVEPDRGVFRGGWRYDANYPNSDNSTAQWGALPLLYANSWGLGFPQWVLNELDLWVTYIQNANGGSGYDHPGAYVNVSKTGGLLLQFAAIGDDVSTARVQAALGFIDSRWNTACNNTWYGNLNHPYAMWAVYKALEVYALTDYVASGGEDIMIGEDMPSAPGGFTIGQDWDPLVSLAGDWYSHYCDYLCVNQNPGDGSWNGYSYWTGALAGGWYINILNARGAPPPQEIEVALDIHPTSCPNPLRTSSGGVTPVAILGTSEFDVTQVDPATVLLEGVAPLRWSWDDVATPFSGDFDGDCLDCNTEAADGYLDLTLKFRTPELVAAIEAGLDAGDELEDRECLTLTLTGNLLEEFDGTAIRGEDVVRIQLGGNGPQLGGKRPPTVPVEFEGVSPNPLYLFARIGYRLAEPGTVKLTVYDLRGRLVSELFEGPQPAGRHSLTWDARELASGVYFVRLQANGVDTVHRVVSIK